MAKLLYVNYMAGALLHAYLYAAIGNYLTESVSFAKELFQSKV